MSTHYFIRHGKPTQQNKENGKFAKEDVHVRFYRHVDKGEGDGCWLWVGNKDKGGYGKFTLAKGIYKRSHRVAWVLAGNPEPLPSVYLLHSCDNPACVRPEHLRCGTQKENIADMDRKGRRPKGYKRPAIQGDNHPFRKHPERVPRGESSGVSKLTDDGVREIRRMFSEGATITKIAQAFGLHKSTVSAVVNRKRWTHVDDTPAAQMRLL